MYNNELTINKLNIFFIYYNIYVQNIHNMTCSVKYKTSYCIFNNNYLQKYKTLLIILDTRNPRS